MEIFRHNDLKDISRVVHLGGIIIYPTDTIWGLGCNALDESAVAKLKSLKGKPADASLICLLPSISTVEKYYGQVSNLEKRLLKTKHTSVIIHGQAVRVIRSGWLNKFLTVCGVPMIATSANLHGQPVIKSWRQATTLFQGKTDAVVRGRKIYQNKPSALVVVDDSVNPSVVKVLRPATTKLR
ncbi:MAG: Sua5/YciO/YrdC/YwlC family protein [Clostridia bacterium]|nr:Sua5/YciO/YrdC/YwlC family protein [Clostridia bacterium]